MTVRAPIREFELANPLYKNASVSWYTVAAGVKTSTLATLYAVPSGATQVVNPTKLNSKGQFKQAVYLETQAIGVVEGISVPGHDTGVHSPYPMFQFTAAGLLQYSYDGGVTYVDAGTLAATTASSLVADDAGGSLWTTVKAFIVYLMSSAGSSVIGFIQAGVGAILRTLQDKGREWVSDADFNGDIQKAIDRVGSTGGGVVRILNSAAISRTKGTNDSWGLKIAYSNVHLVLNDGVVLSRADSIVADADAYPIIFIGTPDSNVAAAVENVTIKGGTLEGSDVRHAVVGSDITDKRYAIEVKNTKHVRIKDVTFTQIDSAAIVAQKPDTYDYGNAAYYNTTKNYDLKVLGCSFLATAHATVGRALIHAISTTGVDRCIIENNYAEWCDDFVVQGGTYDDVEDVETDTYVGDGGFAVKRTGRGLAVKGNTIFNSSEHALYLNGMDVVASGNTITTDAPAICNGDPVKIRGRCVSVSGNTISANTSCISVNESAFNVSVSGNTCTALTVAGSAAGVIDINSDGLLAYIAARAYLATDYPVANISVTGNTIQMPAAAQTYGYAFRIFSDAAAGALADGHVRAVNISGNTILNANVVVYFYNFNHRSVKISGNMFRGKTFSGTSFVGASQAITASDAAADSLTCVGHGLVANDAFVVDTGVALAITSTGATTSMASGGVYYVKTKLDDDTFTAANMEGGTIINITNNSTGAFRKLNSLLSTAVVLVGTTGDALTYGVSFSGNHCEGFKYGFKHNVDAIASARVLPWGIVGNTFRHVYQLHHMAFATVESYNGFSGNVGIVPDRRWRSSRAINNGIGDGYLSGSYDNGHMLLVGSTDVRIYYDDAGNYKAL